MKIICFTESLAAGGAQRQLVNLAILFKAQGYDVDFLVYREEDFFKTYLDDAGIIVHRVSNRNNLDRIISTRNYIRSSDVDIVISFLEVPNFIACLATIGGHKWKLITTELSAKKETFFGARSKLFLWFQSFSDKIVCNSKNAESMWRQHCPRYAHKLHTIYNPVLISEKISEDESCDKKFHRQILIPASYQYLKNPLRLIEAIHMLSDAEREFIRVEWYGKKEPMLGNTAAYDDSCKLINKYHLCDIVKLHEQTDGIFDHMVQADAIGLFSILEGLPNAVCEGMMLSKPIIMSKVSDYDVLSKGSGFILCEPTNTESIRNALAEFLKKDDEELENMGKSNRILANELFKPECIMLQWCELLEELVTAD